MNFLENSVQPLQD